MIVSIWIFTTIEAPSTSTYTKHDTTPPTPPTYDPPTILVLCTHRTNGEPTVQYVQ